LLVKGEYGYELVPPERFELPAPAFVAQCSNPNELRWCIEFESSSITVIATIDPCNKAGREGDTSLGIHPVDTPSCIPIPLKRSVGHRTRNLLLYSTFEEY